MRQWHQGKEGFMKVTRIQDKYNPDKVWMIKRYLCGTFYVNQEIKGQKFYDRDRRMTTGTVAKITHIALGSGGVNGDGTVIVPLAENVALKKEVVRKPYTSSTKTSDTSYEYTIKLEEDELVGTFISEMALIDEDGDVVAFSNFLAKGKDETEVTFTIEDNY